MIDTKEYAAEILVFLNENSESSPEIRLTGVTQILEKMFGEIHNKGY